MACTERRRGSVSISAVSCSNRLARAAGGAEEHGLENAVAVKRALQQVAVHPEFRFQRAAAGLEQADDVPGVAADRHRLAEAHVLEPASQAHAEHRLVRAGGVPAALRQTDVRVHVAGVGRRAADRDVRLASALLGPRDNEDAFEHHQFPAVLRGDERQLADDARRFAQHLALQLRVGALAHDDDVVRTAGRRHDFLEARGQRKQRHEDHDDQRDAADGHGGGALPHGDAAQAVDERDCHGHTLRSASVALSRIPAIAGTMPLAKPVSAARPTAASIDSPGR